MKSIREVKDTNNGENKSIKNGKKEENNKNKIDKDKKINLTHLHNNK